MEFFKIKKVKYLGTNKFRVSDRCERIQNVEKEVVAIVLPTYKITIFQGQERLDFSKDSVDIFTLTGGKITIENKNIINISSTRITNKAIKESLEIIIKEEKNKYYLVLDILKKQEMITSSMEQLAKNNSLIDNQTEKLLKTQNILSECDFKNSIINNIGYTDFRINFDFNDSRLTSIILTKSVEIRRYLDKNNCNFSFVSFDGEYMSVDSDKNDCIDFKELVKYNFKPLKITNINNIPLKTMFYPVAGDKNSLDVIQSILLNVNYIFNTKNIKEISDLINKIIDLAE